MRSSTLVDAEPQNYTVRHLTKWKKDREDQFSTVGDTLRQRYVEEVTDEAERTDLGAPRTLAAYVKFLDDQNFCHEIDENTPSEVRIYAAKLRHLSGDDRELVRAIIEKAIALGGSREGDYGVHVHPDDLKTLSIGTRRLSDNRIKQIGNTLERNDLGGLDYGEEPELYINVPNEYIIWSDLKIFLEENEHTLRDLICGQNFGELYTCLPKEGLMNKQTSYWDRLGRQGPTPATDDEVKWILSRVRREKLTDAQKAERIESKRQILEIVRSLPDATPEYLRNLPRPWLEPQQSQGKTPHRKPTKRQ